MDPIFAAFLGGGASGMFGGAGGGGCVGVLMGGLMKNGGLDGMLKNLFGGPQSAGCEKTEQMFGDLESMMGELLERRGDPGSGGCSGSSYGMPGGGCHAAPSDEPGCVHKPMPDHGCDGAEKHGCDGAEKPEWDGKDKSPSLDRERGAVRLLEQARNTDDPEQKRALIDMALDMLGKGPKTDGL
ncbi:MAG: hypothetical protein OEU92_34565 [Alphaproteobacteria bacterium]|nr:hypothetical protein [Alphaproteobacteria bacterium]